MILHQAILSTRGYMRMKPKLPLMVLNKCCYFSMRFYVKYYRLATDWPIRFLLLTKSTSYEVSLLARKVSLVVTQGRIYGK